MVLIMREEYYSGFLSVVVSCLVKNGERQDEDNAGAQIRVSALKALCHMCPSHSLSVRALCVSPEKNV